MMYNKCKALKDGKSLERSLVGVALQYGEWWEDGAIASRCPMCSIVERLGTWFRER